MKKDYRHYKVSDFLNDDSFLKWMRGEEQEDNDLWDHWKDSFPEAAEEFEEAKSYYYHILSFERKLPAKELKSDGWNKIEKRIEEKDGMQKLAKKKRFKWMARAAVVIALVGAWFAYKSLFFDSPQWIVFEAGSKTEKIALPDESHITLNKNSTLKYNETNPRELWLDGEAVFDVKSIQKTDGSRERFVVHAGKEDVEVLGTIFSVKTHEEAASIILKEGSVRATMGDKFILMRPGERVQWVDNAFVKEKVDPQLYLAWTEEAFHFDKTSLKELAVLIKEYYGYDLRIENQENLGNKTISGTVDLEDENVLWKTLEVILDVRIIKEGDEIIMRGK